MTEAPHHPGAPTWSGKGRGMALKNRGRTLAAGLLAGVLVGGGFAMVTPAGAAVKEAASAINWKNIWQTEIKPRADKRYFTKKKANARFYTKIETTSIFESKVAHDASLLNYYTKADSDARYYTKVQSDANYYTKPQSDAKYAPFPNLMRGVYMVLEDAGQDFAAGGVSFPYPLSLAPTLNVIPVGGPPTAACPGTVANPQATAGNFCIYQRFLSGATTLSLTNLGAGNGTFGVYILADTPAPQYIEASGSWAVRPLALGSTSFAPSHGGFSGPAEGN